MLDKFKEIKKNKIILAAILLVGGLILGLSSYAYSKGTDNFSVKKNGEKYYSENKKFIILNISGNMTAYINKKNQKVYYYYNKFYYFWNNGIWFCSKEITGMFKITPLKDIPEPLRHGPLLRVKKKNVPAGFAALKVPPQPVKHELPNAAAQHLYDLPLTLHGLVIYQKKFNFNAIAK
ncbi:MAG: hypothetical protein M0Z72_03420 [Deltaproteobacteria bacterium]|nr:hypothetical protein [Deltaproteobacteria bacterium]